MSLLASLHFSDYVKETYGKDSYTSIGCGEGDDGLYNVSVDLKNGRRLTGIVQFTGAGITFIKPLEDSNPQQDPATTVEVAQLRISTYLKELLGAAIHTEVEPDPQTAGVFDVTVKYNSDLQLQGALRLVDDRVEVVEPLRDPKDEQRILHTIGDVIVAKQIKQENGAQYERILILKNNLAYTISHWHISPAYVSKAETAAVTMALAITNDRIKASDEPYVYHIKAHDEEHLDLVYDALVQVGFHTGADVKLLNSCKDTAEAYIEITDPLAQRLGKLLEK